MCSFLSSYWYVELCVRPEAVVVTTVSMEAWRQCFLSLYYLVITTEAPCWATRGRRGVRCCGSVPPSHTQVDSQVLRAGFPFWQNPPALARPTRTPQSPSDSFCMNFSDVLGCIVSFWRVPLLHSDTGSAQTGPLCASEKDAPLDTHSPMSRGR